MPNMPPPQENTIQSRSEQRKAVIQPIKQSLWRDLGVAITGTVLGAAVTAAGVVGGSLMYEKVTGRDA